MNELIFLLFDMHLQKLIHVFHRIKIYMDCNELKRSVHFFRNRVKNFGHIVSKEHDDKKDIDKTKHLPTYSNSK